MNTIEYDKPTTRAQLLDMDKLPPDRYINFIVTLAIKFKHVRKGLSYYLSAVKACGGKVAKYSSRDLGLFAGELIELDQLRPLSPHKDLGETDLGDWQGNVLAEEVLKRYKELTT